jgi:hypothetical protein
VVSKFHFRLDFDMETDVQCKSSSCANDNDIHVAGTTGTDKVAPDNLTSMADLKSLPDSTVAGTESLPDSTVAVDGQNAVENSVDHADVSSNVVAGAKNGELNLLNSDATCDIDFEPADQSCEDSATMLNVNGAESAASETDVREDIVDGLTENVQSAYQPEVLADIAKPVIESPVTSSDTSLDTDESDQFGGYTVNCVDSDAEQEPEMSGQENHEETAAAAEGSDSTARDRRVW